MEVIFFVPLDEKKVEHFGFHSVLNGLDSHKYLNLCQDRRSVHNKSARDWFEIWDDGTDALRPKFLFVSDALQSSAAIRRYINNIWKIMLTRYFNHFNPIKSNSTRRQFSVLIRNMKFKKKIRILPVIWIFSAC